MCTPRSFVTATGLISVANIVISVANIVILVANIVISVANIVISVPNIVVEQMSFVTTFRRVKGSRRKARGNTKSEMHALALACIPSSVCSHLPLLDPQALILFAWSENYPGMQLSKVFLFQALSVLDGAPCHTREPSVLTLQIMLRWWLKLWIWVWLQVASTEIALMIA